MELIDKDYFGHGLEDTLEIQRRMNVLNEIVQQFLEGAFPEREQDSVLSADIVLEDVLDAEIVW